MVVLYPDFSPSVLGGQPSLMMLTNKSLLATGAEFGLVRRSERSLPIESSPCWHFFFSKYSIIQIYFHFFFSSPCSFIYMIFFFFLVNDLFIWLIHNKKRYFKTATNFIYIFTLFYMKNCEWPFITFIRTY